MDCSVEYSRDEGTQHIGTIAYASGHREGDERAGNRTGAVSQETGWFATQSPLLRSDATVPSAVGA